MGPGSVDPAGHFFGNPSLVLLEGKVHSFSFDIFPSPVSFSKVEVVLGWHKCHFRDVPLQKCYMFILVYRVFLGKCAEIEKGGPRFRRTDGPTDGRTNGRRINWPPPGNPEPPN